MMSNRNRMKTRTMKLSLLNLFSPMREYKEIENKASYDSSIILLHVKSNKSFNFERGRDLWN